MVIQLARCLNFPGKIFGRSGYPRDQRGAGFSVARSYIDSGIARAFVGRWHVLDWLDFRHCVIYFQLCRLR